MVNEAWYIMLVPWLHAFTGWFSLPREVIDMP